MKINDRFRLGRYLVRYSKIITENLTKTSGILSEGLTVSFDCGNKQRSICLFLVKILQRRIW